MQIQQWRQQVKHLRLIAAEPFFQWFIWIGGSGCTIGLAILMAFRAKSKYASSLGKTCIVPSLFNINEPVFLGHRLY